ncbi:MAG: flavodoxin [Chloroflexi bacterium]|jgi:multimeric flavodoxin WrbA|nr:flavodoxin [Chloroflexota bacterium]
MKITVLNGSPKGETSVTMQYVRYIQKHFPQHELEIVNIAQRLKKIERDATTFQEIIDQVRASDGILWAFPLYVFLVHSNYKRFIELIWERGTEDAFAGKHAAALSTSIHFFDHTAHNYVHAICDDLEMTYTGAFSAEMQDLLHEEGQAKLTRFAEDFFHTIETRRLAPRRYAPLVPPELDYVPGPVEETVDVGGKHVVILTDATPDQTNLNRMIERGSATFAQDVEVINLRDLNIKGGCLGCLRCGYNYECAYTGKDEFINVYNARLKTADILIFAGALHDRYLSATWKQFFDRGFFNTHTPSLVGKQFGFIISGPLAQVPNLRQILQAYVEWQRSNLVGFVTDEFGDSAHIDHLLHSLAGQLAKFAASDYIQPHTFLSVGGMKVFRDDVWSKLRMVFQADHRAYKRMGVYDFPQRNIGVRLLNTFVAPLFRIPQVREAFNSKIKEGMIQPYQRVLQDG